MYYFRFWGVAWVVCLTTAHIPGIWILYCDNLEYRYIDRQDRKVNLLITHLLRAQTIYYFNLFSTKKTSFTDNIRETYSGNELRRWEVRKYRPRFTKQYSIGMILIRIMITQVEINYFLATTLRNSCYYYY